MDFSFVGDRGWNRDQIGVSNIMNHTMSDIFMTAPKINRQIQWPPRPPVSKKPDGAEPLAPPMHDLPYGYMSPAGVEGFSAGGMDIHLTESTLIMFLLVILIIVSAMAYNTMRQVRDLLLIRAGAT